MLSVTPPPRHAAEAAAAAFRCTDINRRTSVATAAQRGLYATPSSRLQQTFTLLCNPQHRRSGSALLAVRPLHHSQEIPLKASTCFKKHT